MFLSFENIYRSQILPWLRNTEGICQGQPSSQEAMLDALVSEAGSTHPRFHLPFARLQQQTEHILPDLLVDSIPTKITAPRQCCGILTIKRNLGANKTISMGTFVR